jgi:hypothetical protein
VLAPLLLVVVVGVACLLAVRWWRRWKARRAAGESAPAV